MGMVTFALFILFFSIESKDERESAFSPGTFADRTFARTTSVSFVLLVLSTVLDIFHAVMKTATLGVWQWLIWHRRGPVGRGGRRDPQGGAAAARAGRGARPRSEILR
jgi:hypothetical protein